MQLNRQGFTLLEILVAITVMSLIAMFSWQTIASTANVQVILDAQQAQDREVDGAIHRLEREISLAFLTKSTTAINTYQTVFIGQDESDMDRLFFASKSHQQTVRNARECDQAEITLWTEPDPEGLGTYVLFHRETGRVDHEPDVGGKIVPLLRNVTRFDLRYLDPEDGEWREDWDTTGMETPNRLPRAVQMVISVQHADPLEPSEIQEETHVRTILLETAPAITQSLLSGQQGSGTSAPSLGFGGLSR